MKSLYRYSKCLPRIAPRIVTPFVTLVVIASLVAQTIFVAFPPAPARAASITPSNAPQQGAPPAQTEPAQTEPAQAESEEPQLVLAVQARKLEKALQQLEEATDEASFLAAAAAVEATWSDLLLAEQQLRLRMETQAQRLASIASTNASARQAATLEMLATRFGEMTNLYASLADAIANNRGAVGERIAALAALLQQATQPPPRPNLDILPRQPVPKVKAPTVALGFAVAADAQDHPLASALPAQGGPPTEEDMTPTEDADIRPEIQALADQLGRDPVAIYAFVRNSIAFEPYYGSRKGSLLTYWERSGSDADIASLLIALLRASEIPARYVEGRVAVDAARAQNWVGNAPDLDTAGTILSTGGVTVTLTPEGDLVKEHIWVAAYVNDTWIPLDASFKQYTFTEPTDFASFTGFDAGQLIDELRATANFSDAQQSLSEVPELADPAVPEDDNAVRDFADVKVDDAISRTMEFIDANPDLTNADLLGGAYIITETIDALPESFPLAVLPDPPVIEYSVLPEGHRAYITIEVINSFAEAEFSHRVSLPSLTNKRVTVSYEAATPEDQAVIDENGGSLITTPPVIDVVPVLRIGGSEVARGGPDQLGAFQTRRLTFTYPKGATDTVENFFAVGDTFAIGIAYGRTSPDAISASQVRLADVRDAPPPTSLPEQPQPGQDDQTFFPFVSQDGAPGALDVAAQSQPSSAQENASTDDAAPAEQAQSSSPDNGEQLDPDDPANMSERVIGEMLHLSLQSYFSQNDLTHEVAARGRQIRWWRHLSVGIATQELVVDRIFETPLSTLGGAMAFDVQRDAIAAVSLRNQPADEQAFYRFTGHFSSALEHSTFEEVGAGSVSTIRLHALALEDGIPVYRIDATNRDEVFPLLELDTSIEDEIARVLDDGRIVTVSQESVEIGDWSGTGWIVQDPATGASAYLISGGLAGNQATINGGSFFETLKTIGGFALLALNMGLDVWGVISGIALLLTPEPTLVTKVAGIALIAGSLAALGFDASDLMDLVSGDKAASQYLGEQINGFIVGAILKRFGLAAAPRIINRLGPQAAPTVIRQLDQYNSGLSTRFTSPCAEAAAPNQSCNLFTPTEYFALVRLLPQQRFNQIHEDMHEVASRFGGDVVRAYANNRFFIRDRLYGTRLGNMMDAIRRAPRGEALEDGIIDTIRRGSTAQNVGFVYELVRARENVANGLRLLRYGDRVEVQFDEIADVVNGVPVPGRRGHRAPLEGDSTYLLGPNSELWTDSKHSRALTMNTSYAARVLNQFLKAQAAIDNSAETGITQFRFEFLTSVGDDVKDWARQNAPDVEIVERLGGSLNRPPSPTLVARVLAFFDRLLERGRMITQAIHRRKSVPNVSGPLTASQAFQIAQGAATQHDPQARLALLASDRDISSKGYSDHWTFYFDLPDQRAEATVEVISNSEVETSGASTILCVESVRPFIVPGSMADSWLRAGEVTQQWVNEQWQAHLDSNPSLPTPFRDSSEAVRDLSAQGVNFISGDTDMALSAEVLPTGEAVWRIIAYGDDYQTPFAA